MPGGCFALAPWIAWSVWRFMYYNDRDSLDGCLGAVLLAAVMLLIVILVLRWGIRI